MEGRKEGSLKRKEGKAPRTEGRKDTKEDY
jgi:hypothetical protein